MPQNSRNKAHCSYNNAKISCNNMKILRKLFVIFLEFSLITLQVLSCFAKDSHYNAKVLRNCANILKTQIICAILCTVSCFISLFKQNLTLLCEITESVIS